MDVLAELTIAINETGRSASDIVEDALRAYLQMTMPKRLRFHSIAHYS